MTAEIPLLTVSHLTTCFYIRGREIRAVDDINLNILRGQTLGLVGESGCGKSVTAHSIIRLIPTPPGKITAGRIEFEGTNLLELSEREMRSIRGNRISMIFQEPMTSLNPVYTVGNQVGETIRVHQKLSKAETRNRVIDVFRLVKIPAPEKRIHDFPHQMSGGMRQRVMIAMALACNPRLMIADEPTTALDVTIQAQVINLLKDLQQSFGLTYLFISHDLSVVEYISDRVAVMYLGKLVEIADSRSLYQNPCHPYTQALLSASPVPDPTVRRDRIILKGDVPSPIDPPSGCRFHTRCLYAQDICSKQEPEMKSIATGHDAACLFAGQLAM